MNTTTKKKITRSTVKSFIKKNAKILFIEKKSDFDGMQDMVTESEGGFKPVTFTEWSQKNADNTLGINGAWFVGESRDYFTAFENETFVGFHVYNCCGSFNLAIKK